MSETDAQEFLARVEHEEVFAAELEGLKEDPQAVLARVRAEGFDVTPAEIRDAFLERFRAELSLEQLEAVAAGTDSQTVQIAIGATMAVLGVGLGIVAAVA